VTAAEFPSVSEAISQETIDRYADISGDYNPLHVDQEAAAASEFGGTIAHGPIALQTFFRSLTGWLGSEAPPAGTSVAVTFRHPVRPGDTISCELRERSDAAGAAELAAECVNQDATPVISVKAEVPEA
jgi:3-hydroxybutyryl-CoA dehydratase